VIGLDVVATQVEAVRRRFPLANMETLSDGTRVLIVPGVRAAPGYSAPSTTVRIVVPVGYPNVPLDCFYTDLTLTLAGGQAPQNTGIQPLGGVQLRWFSWHINSWDPNSDDLDTFVRVCERRLRDPK
jgi:hypothetical protein